MKKSILTLGILLATSCLMFGQLQAPRQGVAGVYNSIQVQGVWTIGSNYKINTSTNDFGNQWGMVYAHTNSGTGTLKKPIANWGHQILFTGNGNRTASISLDNGNAYFAGKLGLGTTTSLTKLSLSGNETPKVLGTSTECAIRIRNEYATGLGANSEIQFGIGSNDQTGATIASKYTNYDNGKVGADLIFGTQSTNVGPIGVVERMRITHDGILKMKGKIEVQASETPLNGSITGLNQKSAISIINEYTSAFGGFSELQFKSGQDHKKLATIAAQYTDEAGGYVGGDLIFATSTTNTAETIERMRIAHNGNVGIGTSAVSGFKLSVAGKMRAEEIEVSLSTGWADYVFAEDYKLNSLEEVEAYITKNNHLPNVPSEKEVKEEGINLGEMDAVLLRKIEELTLYIIEQDKRIKELEK
jgi:hypothetical protein